MILMYPLQSPKNVMLCSDLLLQAELTFCTGDIITVIGEIDEDGFYYVSGFSVFSLSSCTQVM